jgi:hypothetical protein
MNNSTGHPHVRSGAAADSPDLFSLVLTNTQVEHLHELSLDEFERGHGVFILVANECGATLGKEPVTQVCHRDCIFSSEVHKQFVVERQKLDGDGDASLGLGVSGFAGRLLDAYKDNTKSDPSSTCPVFEILPVRHDSGFDDIGIWGGVKYDAIRGNRG